MLEFGVCVCVCWFLFDYVDLVVSFIQCIVFLAHIHALSLPLPLSRIPFSVRSMEWNN